MWLLKGLAMLVLVLIGLNDAYKILAIFPTLAKSHYFVGSALVRELAEKGHEVTMISPFSTKPPAKNVNDIVTTPSSELVNGFTPNFFEMKSMYIFQTFLMLYNLGATTVNATLQSKGVQELMNSKQKFDVIICEAFAIEAFLGFGHHFHAPVVAVSTFGASGFTTRLVGSPSPPSYVPNAFLPYTDRMTLLERVHNIITETIDHILYEWYHIPMQEKLYDQYFPDPKPDFRDITKNVSLVLLNTHFSLGRPRPYAVNMIEVGGLQVNRKPKPLPADIQSFLDSAKDGAIYFSMGSNLKGVHFPVEKRNAILAVFRTLKQKILWKWEDESLPGKPDNVLIKSWFPQDDILAHPNIKLFITHGGLLSTTESVYHGVPIVGIPVFGDQPLNMALAEKAGFGKKVDLEHLDEEHFMAAVNEVLTNIKYADHMKKISDRYRNQPQTPLETAVFWVEYVARHNGAPHMKSAGQELSFIQYHNIDALAIIFAIIAIIMYALKSAFSALSSLVCDRKERYGPEKKHK